MGWLRSDEQADFACPNAISHQLIVRSQEEKRLYEEWKNSPCKEKVLSYISNNYKTWLTTSCDQCDAIDFLKLPSYRGFIIHFMDIEHDCNEVTCLFDYLKERVLELGYKSYVSDEKLVPKSRWMERTERHYLKPLVSLKKNEKIEQRFGNINIELRFRDDEALHLKFTAATFHNCQFKNAEEFDELMNYITKTEVN